MNNNDDAATVAASDMSEIPLDRIEAGASLPAPEEVRMSASSRPGSSSRHRTLNSILCFAVVLILVIICFIVFTDREGLGSSKSSNSDARKFSYESLVDYLVENGISSQEMFYNASRSTPQAMAARWLADEDPRNLALPTEGVQIKSGYHFVTRYVLATMFYAMAGPTWRQKFDFLSFEDVCGWRGIGGYIISTGQPVPAGALCDSNGEVSAIYLDRNNLNGNLPSEITALTRLRSLDLSFNDNIKGTIPSDIGKLVLLESLALADNKFTGRIPESLCDLRFLKDMYFFYNQLSGSVPACIGAMTNLETLHLSNNFLSGALPPSIGNLQKLDGIWLDDNILGGDVSTMFNNLTNLRGLFLEDNEFLGTLDDNFLKNNRRLLQLDLSNNNFIGYVPAHFFDPKVMPFLEMLDLHNNRLAGVLPTVSENNTELNFISLHSNSIGGNLPESWGTFRGLFHLDLSSNLLMGTIPAQLGNMTGLTYLFLANNTFTPAPIPDSFAQLTDMREFSLKRTYRTGNLPEWIADWKDIILLDLDQNNFVGNIPPVYGNLTKLQFLLLNRNNIGGQLPTSFSAMTSLRALFLEKNQMTGSLDFLCDLSNFKEREGDADGTEIIAADCAGGAGNVGAQITCGCCKFCCIPEFPDPDEGHDDEETCHDATAIASLDPIWEVLYDRRVFDFGNQTKFIDRDYIG